MLVSMKKRTVRPNTVRNYTERYERNIDPVQKGNAGQKQYV